MSTDTIVVENYGWKFDYTPYKFIYDVTDDIVDTHKFNKALPTIETDLMEISMLSSLRTSAIIHRLTRANLRKKLVDSAKFIDIVDFAEKEILKLSRLDTKTYFSSDMTECGIAFPIGVSVNEIAAHDTAVIDDTRMLEKGDIVKIDMGVHKDGFIIDSAFTCIVGDDGTSPYNELLKASADSVYSAIAISGPDARLYEISETIAEVIGSYQVDMNGKMIDVVPVYGLGGHNIERNKLHAGKLILSRPHKIQENQKMEEGEVYAIETYASTGYGTVSQTMSNVSHYALADGGMEKRVFRRGLKNSKSGFEKWLQNRGGLPFTQRWFDPHIKRGQRSVLDMLNAGVITAYPPLTDNKDSKIAQFEHTIYIKGSGVEILSLGDDY